MFKMIGVSAVLVVFVMLVAEWGAAKKVADARDYYMSSDEQVRMARVIQRAGYMCPLAKAIHMMGPEPRGDAMRVYCGPVEGDGLFPNLRYRVIIRPSGLWTAEPWR